MYVLLPSLSFGPNHTTPTSRFRTPLPFICRLKRLGIVMLRCYPAKSKRGRDKKSVINCRKLSVTPLRESSRSCAQAANLGSHALMRSAVSPRGSPASSPRHRRGRPCPPVGCTQYELAMLLGAACKRVDPTALSWRSVWRKKKAFLVGQGVVVCG